VTRMSWKKLSRFSPRVALLLAVATAVPLAALLWVGWRALEQDRALENEQIRQQVERAADIVAAALQRAVAVSERRLAQGSKDWPAGAAAMTMSGETVQVWPMGRAAYLPVAPQLTELPGVPFAAGEAVEFRQRDLNGAAAIYRDLAGSNRREVRVGALLRLARCLRASGKQAEALPFYARLLEEDGLAFEGVPVSLVARQARCSLMEAMKQAEDLRREAAALGSDLQQGRWPLTRALAQLYAQDAERWGITSLPGQLERELLADGLSALWQRLSQAGSAGSGRESIDVGQEGTVVAIWNRSGDRVSALVVTPQFVSAQWLGAIDPVLKQQRVKLTLHNSSRGLSPGAVRRADETGLPWTVVVASSDPALERSRFQLRRRMLVTGFLILALLAISASYLMFRAISRELAAVRLQSDFVAAVSHEFRTPLTSLRQFTDMMREHKNLSDERRDLCYEAQARSTARLTRLVESLLDFGQMEGGARIYHFAPLDCGELVRRVVEEFQNETQSSGFQYRLAVRSSAEIDADGEALERALWNLLDNAVKYSGDNREIEVEVDGAGQEVTIAVRDRGLGIPAHEQAAVFRKFQRGGDAVKLGIKGTGIGLAMVDHIMKAHHGRVELQSDPGQGSTFRLILPARR
jgi:two-component system, OmpR family, phosphate regulon sensor histidine kinase PhoR